MCEELHTTILKIQDNRKISKDMNRPFKKEGPKNGQLVYKMIFNQTCNQRNFR